MNNYLFILIWFLLLYLVFSAKNILKINEDNDSIYEDTNKVTFLMALFVFLPLILWAAGRINFWDTDNYRRVFLSLPESFNNISDFLMNVEKDKGFTVISIFIKFFIGNNVYMYFFILAFIQAICLIYVYRNYSTNYLLSVFLFFISTDYFSWMFNAIRQFLVVALFFALISLILKRRYITLIIGILVISSIHGSALILIPSIFFLNGKPWSKKTIIFMLLFGLFIYFFGSSLELMGDFLQNTQYENVITSEIWNSDDGTSLIRVVIYSIPTILAFIGRNQIAEFDDEVINLSVNMSILSTLFYIISMFTSGIYIGRLPIYFSLYNYILLPWEIENLFNDASKKIVYFIMILGYLLFYYFQIHFSWGLI